MTEPRAVYVTGASSGIGRAVAEELAGLGWRVALGARRQERLEETAAAVSAAGGDPFTHFLDVTDPASIERFFVVAEAAVGPVDVLINNAGVATPGWLHALTTDVLIREVATNLLGAVLATRLAVASMRERERGDLVFITSDATRHPRPRMATYTATKAGLEAFVHALTMELEGTGVRATTVRVGPTITEFGFGWPMDELEDLMTYWPRFGLQRHAGLLDAATVAQAVRTAVTAPRGVHLETIEVQPEAPVGEGVPPAIIERPADT